MRIPLFGLLLLAPLAAAASDNCKHSSPRTLALDLAGVKTVRVETQEHDVRLRAAPGASHALQGRACASQPEWLADLTLTQERQGDTLVVRARREREGGLSNLFGNNYARLELSGTVPDHLPVQLVVGSGDGLLEGAASASADVGSGDAGLRGIRGAVTAKVGSGDIEVDGAGSLKVLSIGSGDVSARNIGGKVEVGSIGSGDFELDGAHGDVKIGSIGSAMPTCATCPVRCGWIRSVRATWTCAARAACRSDPSAAATSATATCAAPSTCRASADPANPSP